MREDQQFPTVHVAGPPAVLGVGPDRGLPLPSVGPESNDTHPPQSGRGTYLRAPSS